MPLKLHVQDRCTARTPAAALQLCLICGEPLPQQMPACCDTRPQVHQFAQDTPEHTCALIRLARLQQAPLHLWLAAIIASMPLLQAALQQWAPKAQFVKHTRSQSSITHPPCHWGQCKQAPLYYTNPGSTRVDHTGLKALLWCVQHTLPAVQADKQV